MGWRDAPLVNGQEQAAPAWASAPLVEQQPSTPTSLAQDVYGMEPNIPRPGVLPLPSGLAYDDPNDQRPVDFSDWTAPAWLHELAKSSTLPAAELVTPEDITMLATNIGLPSLRGIGSATKSVVGKRLSPSEVSAAPSTSALKTQANKLYDEAKISGDVIPAETFADNLADMEATLYRSGYDPDAHPDTKNAFKAISKRYGKDLDMAELQLVRDFAKGAAGSINPKDARIGSILLNKINKIIDDTQGEGAAILREADTLYGAAKKSETLEKALVAAQNTASGVENGIRIELRKIVNNPKKSKYFSAEELAVMEEVIQGVPGANTARFVAGFGPGVGQQQNKLLAMLAAGAGGMAGGLPGMVAPMGVGYAGGHVAKGLTTAGANRARAYMTGARPGMQQVTPLSSSLARTSISQGLAGQMSQQPQQKDILSKGIMRWLTESGET